MLKHVWVAAAAVVMIAASTGGAVAGPAGEIPPQFRGAGCNLKYTYARTPKNDASDCINAKAGRKEGDSHDNDNFIRILKDFVGGVEWGCKVKSVKSVSDTEMTFAGDCGAENTSYTSTVTLLLRPGKVVIVDEVVEGRHTVDAYHILDGLE